MSWGAPYWFLGLGVVLMGLIWDWRKSVGQEKGGRWPHIKQLWASREGFLGSNPKKGSKRLFWWLGLGWVMVALARPQWGQVEQVVFDRSRDVLIGLDLSRSMLAEDVKPSRLERAKLLLSGLLSDLKGERVGLLVFSGTAFLQSPLSADYEVLQEFMPELMPHLLPQGGTDYGRMLKVALEAFTEEAGADRFLIVLSDGESRTEDWREQVKGLKEKKIRVIGLGIGTPEGGVIPDGEGGWVKEKNGAVVLSKLEAKSLQDLAQQTGGVYQEASGWVDIKSLIERTVIAGQTTEVKEKREERQAERFQIFLALAVLCWLISLWREFPVKPRSPDFSTKGNSQVWWKIFGRRMSVVLIFFGIFLGEARGQISMVDPINSSTNGESVELPKVIKELSEKRRLSAKDYSIMAEESIRYGKEALAKGDRSVVESVVKDALQGVEVGEKSDSQAADWKRLRQELEELLKQQQQQQKDQDQKQQEQKEQESSQQEEQQNSQENSSQDKESDSSSGKEASDSKNSSENKSEKQEKEGKEKGSEKKQKVGGKKEKETPINATEAGVQQKLEQVKQKDSPARLFQLMEGGMETNTISSDEEGW